MKRNFNTHSSRVSTRKARVWFVLGAVALAGLLVLALLLSLAGSPLAGLAWAGALAVFAGMALYAGVRHWLLSRTLWREVRRKRAFAPRRRLLWVNVAVILALFLNLGQGLIPGTTIPIAYAHNVDQRMNWMFFDQATLDLISARAGANDLPLVRAGDELGIIIKASPQPSGATTGVGGYVTFYIPEGTQVTDVGYVWPDGNDGYTDMPMKGQSIIAIGDGPIGAETTTELIGLTLGANAVGQTEAAVDASGLHRGTLAGVYGDTGIFHGSRRRLAELGEQRRLRWQCRDSR